MGAPSKFKEEFIEQAYKLALLGATDKEMSDFFSVSEPTFNSWKYEKDEKGKRRKDEEGNYFDTPFFTSLKKGKLMADAEISKALYHRAKGYKHPEDKIFLVEGEPLIVPTIKHYPPDTPAAFIWLKNRQPKKWKDKHEVEQTNIDVNIDDLKTEIRQLVKENGFHGDE